MYWFQKRFAIFTLIEILTRICWHGLLLLETTAGTGND